MEGEHSPMELHIVCARTDGSTEGRYLAVLGLLFDTDATADTMHLLEKVNAHIAETSELEAANKETLGSAYERILSAAGEEQLV